QDPLLEELFIEPREITISLTDDYFLSIVSAIVGQQLSGKVAEVIYRRVNTLFEENITASKLANASFDDLRACGLSGRKIEYLQSLANHMIKGELDFSHIDEMSNQDIIDMLVKIKGIGPWTAEMFLLFSIGRENVFSVLDLGLRNGLIKLYKQELSPEEMLEISEKWNPYKSVVSHYLWRYVAKK
ncbi:MAG: DNA-3-methyladenine glycosylase, partial [Candidatus Izemoplasmatales bacterium]|nr:DNA-3-methyladenine glycosylase [Candidatus Izemoplasmatales bacterium]